MYYPYRSTTEKLGEAFKRIQEVGDRIILPLHYLGGRDWVIICAKNEDDE